MKELPMFKLNSEIRLTREVKAYFDLTVPKDAIGTLVGVIGDLEPQGYFIEVMVIRDDKETTEIIEVPMDGIKNYKPKLRKELIEQLP